jgi:hypothetical protein
MHTDLRPLSIGELLDRSFTLYRRHFILFVGIMAVPSLAMLGMMLPMSGFQSVMESPAGVEPDPTAMLLTMSALVGIVIIFGLVYWGAYTLAMGATTKGVSELYLGRTPTMVSCYRSARGHFWRLLLLTLLVMLRMTGLMLLCVGVPAMLAAILTPVVPVLGVLMAFVAILVGSVAAVVFALRYALSAPALMMEGIAANAAIRRSIHLTRGFLGRVFLLALCTVLVTYAGLMIFQMPFLIASVVVGPESSTGFWLDIAGTVMGTLGSAITSPLMMIGFAVLYFDARIRKEAFDLQLMAEALDTAQSGVTPGSGLAPTLPR